MLHAQEAAFRPLHRRQSHLQAGRCAHSRFPQGSILHSHTWTPATRSAFCIHTQDIFADKPALTATDTPSHQFANERAHQPKATSPTSKNNPKSFCFRK